MHKNVLYVTFFITQLICSKNLFSYQAEKTFDQYVIRNWQTTEGLPQNSVESVLQTSDRYIWVATQEGLARFDGIKFKTFSKSNTPAFFSNWVFTLFEDSRKNLWIGTHGGGVIKYSNGSFKTFRKKDGLSDNFVYAITEDKKGNIWVGTENGISVFRNGKIDIISENEGLSQNKIRSLFFDRKGRLWIGTKDAGLNIYKNGKYEVFNTENGLSNNSVWEIFEDDRGRIWVGTNGGGLNIFEKDEIKSYTTKDGLSHDMVRVIIQDKKKNIIIGTLGGGISVFKNNHFYAFNKNLGLSDNNVMSIYEDIEDNIWVGTRGGGLNQLRDEKFTTFGSRNGLSSEIVTPVFEDSRKRLWIGTYKRGLNLWDGKEKKVYKRENGLANNTIWSVFEDKKGGLWIGTFKGLNYFKDGVFKKYTVQNGLTNDNIFAISENRVGALWIGTYGGGLNKFQNGKFTSLGTEDGLGSDKVISLLVDSNDNLWVGTTDGGVSLINGGSIKTYTRKSGLSSNSVFSIFEDKDKNIWIGTVGGGINLYQGEGKFISAKEKDGLYGDSVFVILEDNSGYLWIGSNKGIFKVAKKSLLDFFNKKVDRIESKGYGISDGLKIEECMGGFQPAGFKTEGGKLFFPTAKGLVSIDPDNIKNNSVKPKIVLEKVVVDNNNENIESEIVVGKESKRLSFYFNGLSYVFPEKVVFSYMLEGYDKSWIQAGTHRIASYTSLPRGKYIFKVKARNSDGVWSEDENLLTIHKQEYFYKSAWFIFSFFLTSLVIVYLFFRMQIKIIKARNIRLQKIINENESLTADLKKEMEEKAFLEKQLYQKQKLEAVGNLTNGIAHDFNNILTSILGFLEYEIEEREDNNEPLNSLNHVYKASTRAKKLVQQLLDFSRQDQSSSRSQVANLKAVLEETIQLILPSVPKNIEIRKEFSGIDNAKINGDDTKIHQVLMNIIINGIYAMKDKGGEFKIILSEVTKNEINANINLDYEKYFLIRIEDRGTGIDKETLAHIFEPYFTTKPVGEGTGMGLSVCYGIVKKYGGFINVETEVGKGTAFLIFFPKAEENKKKEIDKQSEKYIAKGGSEHIMVVDDEKFIASLLYIRLGKLGYQVTSFTNPLEALSEFKKIKNQVDLVITDLNMPNFTGEQFAEAVIKESPEMKIIAITGFLKPADEEKLKTKGIRNIVLKPLSFTELNNIIRKNLD